MNLFSILAAALRSVGIAGSVTSAGFYLHRRNMVTADGTKMLAVLTQQLTVPAYLFTKVVSCRKVPADSSDMGTKEQGSIYCGSVTDHMGAVSVLLLWPFYVVGCGLLMGYIAAKVCNLPKSQHHVSLVACALSNSGTLPIVLLTVLHDNPPVPELGSVDPVSFLSIFLLLFPALLWGIGGLLLTNEDSAVGNRMKRESGIEKSTEESSHLLANVEASGVSTTHLNSVSMLDSLRKLTDCGTTATDKSDDTTDDVFSKDEPKTQQEYMVSTPLKSVTKLKAGSVSDLPSFGPVYESTGSARQTECKISGSTENVMTRATPYLSENCGRVSSKVLQPPVVASLLGLAIASVRPLRAVFVDAYSLGHDAPLQWIFDGLCTLGQAVVPVSLTLLGIHLSKTLQSSASDSGSRKLLLSTKITIAIVMAKMVAMPIIGALTVFLIKNLWWEIPKTIAAPFYLVMMITFITPTATNVMVIVELSGSDFQESMARIIGWQYAFAPVLLSLSVALVVAVATS